MITILLQDDQSDDPLLGRCAGQKSMQRVGKNRVLEVYRQTSLDMMYKKSRELSRPFVLCSVCSDAG